MSKEQLIFFSTFKEIKIVGNILFNSLIDCNEDGVDEIIQKQKNPRSIQTG